jgi:hypothetical protein
MLYSSCVVAFNNTGSSPGVLVIGDGLVRGIAQAQNGNGPQELADAIRFWSGRGSAVAAREDVSLSHFMSHTLYYDKPNPLPKPEPPLEPSPLEVAVAQFELDLTVLALGSDDARILTTDGGRKSARYTIGDYRGQLDNAVKVSLASSECVLLVNVADHWSDVVSGPDLAAVNTEIAEVVDADPARVRLADWKTHSAGKNSWFTSPGDIHHTLAGRDAYRDFIVTAVTVALNNGCSSTPAVADEPTQQVLPTPALLPSRGAERTDDFLQGAERGTDQRQTNER